MIIIKHLFGRPAGIGGSLHHQRRHRADDRSFRNPAFTVTSNVVHHFAAARRMADVYCILQVEMRGERRQVVGVVIHVVAVGGL